MKSKTLTLSLLSSIFYGAVESFNAPALFHRPNSLKRNGRGKESIASTFTSSSTKLNYSPISPTELAPVIDYLNLDGPDDLLSSNIQKVEAQLFGDMAHLILDFGTILNPDTIVLRLFIFLGRICSILSDYVPDHSMTYDETLFQFSMLAISSNMLFKKFRIAIASLNETTSFKDRRIYQRIFYPAGFSWFQYKSLLASGVLEWKEASAAEILVEDSDSLIITYRGEINQVINGSDIIHSRMYDGKVSVIGDFSKLNTLIKTKRTKPPKMQQRCDLVNKQTECILLAGSTEATFLRIHMKELLQQAGEDADINECSKCLYFNVMQRRLSLYQDNNTSSNDNCTDTDLYTPQLP